MRNIVEQRDLKWCLETISKHFADLGAEPLDLPFLYPSDELLNLYGEDLRGRAFLYGDAERGDELCLRPDFTVPVALAHRDRGWERKAFYTYAGPVFRLQPMGQDRPIEYLQAGIECFGEADWAATDAEVYCALRQGVRALGIGEVESTVGDLSIVLAVLDALEMPAHWRTALKRHLWRPTRFQDLLERAVHPKPVSPKRSELLRQSSAELLLRIETAGEYVGLRSTEEVLDRLLSLPKQAAEPAMLARDARLISDVLNVRGSIDGIVARIERLTADANTDIGSTLERFEQRLEHLRDAGCSAAELTFDAAFGRSLEYYDGFVFEIRLAGAKQHPPLAGGGRYNAMTVRLGADKEVPAVGGIVRPEAVLGCLS